MPLTAKQISAYIEHRFLADQGSRQRHPDWKRLHDEIDDGDRPALVTAFEVPWLMTLATAGAPPGWRAWRIWRTATKRNYGTS